MEFGKVEYRCPVQKNGISSSRTLHLTLIGLGDQELLSRKGVRALRLNRIMRLTSEAMAQDCLLSYEDLSALLLTSRATLKRDVSFLEKGGNPVELKGRRKNGHGGRPACEERGRGSCTVLNTQGEEAGVCG